MRQANEQPAVVSHSGNKRLTITASEVGEFVFCAKAWQLKRDGAVPESTHLNAGQVFHAKHGARISLAVRLRQASLVLAWIVCLLVLVVLAVWYLVRAS